MSIRLRALLIAVLIIGLAALSIYFINYERAFQNKGELLVEQGHKQYIDPGYLVYSTGSKQGAWAVYRQTGQTIVTLLGQDGVRRFQKVYRADRLLVDSSVNYTVVGETLAQRFTVINTDGETVYNSQGTGTPLFCRVDDYGRSGVVFEKSSSGTAFSWLTTLYLLDKSGQELFSTELGNTEVIDMVWLVDAVAILSYRVQDDVGGQYLTVYDNSGNVLYECEIGQPILDLQVSPSGHQLLWTSSAEAKQYDLLSEEEKVLAKSGLVAAGFSGSQRLYVLENQRSILPPGRRLHGGFSDFTGNLRNRFAYAGTLVKHQLLRDGTVTVATDHGVYALDQWYLESKARIIEVAIDQEGTIFVFTDDYQVIWYRR